MTPWEVNNPEKYKHLFKYQEGQLYLDLVEYHHIWLHSVAADPRYTVLLHIGADLMEIRYTKRK